MQLTADFDYNRITQTSDKYDPDSRVLALVHVVGGGLAGAEAAWQLAEAGVRNIKGYNSLTQEELIERFQPGTPEFRPRRRRSRTRPRPVTRRRPTPSRGPPAARSSSPARFSTKRRR